VAKKMLVVGRLVAASSTCRRGPPGGAELSAMKSIAVCPYFADTAWRPLLSTLPMTNSPGNIVQRMMQGMGMENKRSMPKEHAPEVRSPPHDTSLSAANNRHPSDAQVIVEACHVQYRHVMSRCRRGRMASALARGLHSWLWVGERWAARWRCGERAVKHTTCHACVGTVTLAERTLNRPRSPSSRDYRPPRPFLPRCPQRRPNVCAWRFATDTPYAPCVAPRAEDTNQPRSSHAGSSSDLASRHPVQLPQRTPVEPVEPRCNRSPSAHVAL